MTFLKMLESIRTPLGEQLAAAVTLLGEETFFMLVGLALAAVISARLLKAPQSLRALMT